MKHQLKVTLIVLLVSMAIAFATDPAVAGHCTLPGVDPGSHC